MDTGHSALARLLPRGFEECITLGEGAVFIAIFARSSRKISISRAQIHASDQSHRTVFNTPVSYSIEAI